MAQDLLGAIQEGGRRLGYSILKIKHIEAVSSGQESAVKLASPLFFFRGAVEK